MVSSGAIFTGKLLSLVALPAHVALFLLPIVVLHKQFLLCLRENHMSLEIQSSCANSVNTNTVLVLRAPGQGRIGKARCSFKGSLAAVSSYSGDVQWCLISMAD